MDSSDAGSCPDSLSTMRGSMRGRPLPLKQRTSSTDNRKDYSHQSWIDLLALNKPREYFITVDNFSIWRRHLAWAMENGNDLRTYMTQRFSSSMVFMSLLLAAEVNVLFNSAQITKTMRDNMRDHHVETLEFWIGVFIVISVVLTLMTLMSTFTAWGMVSSLSESNAHCILRSSIGQYAAQLPARLLLMSMYSFLLWVCMFLYLLLPGVWFIFLFLGIFGLFFHVVIVFSSFGRLIMHTGAMGNERIFAEEHEKRLLPRSLHAALLFKAMTQLESNTSITRQYRKARERAIVSNAGIGRSSMNEESPTSGGGGGGGGGGDSLAEPVLEHRKPTVAQPRLRRDSSVRFSEDPFLGGSASPRLSPNRKRVNSSGNGHLPPPPPPPPAQRSTERQHSSGSGASPNLPRPHIHHYNARAAAGPSVLRKSSYDAAAPSTLKRDENDITSADTVHRSNSSSPHTSDNAVGAKNTSVSSFMSDTSLVEEWVQGGGIRDSSGRAGAPRPPPLNGIGLPNRQASQISSVSPMSGLTASGSEGGDMSPEQQQDMEFDNVYPPNNKSGVIYPAEIGRGHLAHSRTLDEILGPENSPMVVTRKPPRTHGGGGSGGRGHHYRSSTLDEILGPEVLGSALVQERKRLIPAVTDNNNNNNNNSGAVEANYHSNYAAVAETWTGRPVTYSNISELSLSDDSEEGDSKPLIKQKPRNKIGERNDYDVEAANRTVYGQTGR